MVGDEDVIRATSTKILGSRIPDPESLIPNP